MIDGTSLVYNTNNRGPNTDPLGTPQLSVVLAFAPIQYSLKRKLDDMVFSVTIQNSFYPDKTFRIVLTRKQLKVKFEKTVVLYER